jgi:AcrR family transcriptional regulator
VSTYHHGNLRPALVETAVELARATGPEGVVLREVARQTGVSHNAAYRHFADRDELLAELVESGGLPRARRPGADVACWAAVHGFAMLNLRGPMHTLPAVERDAVLSATLDVVDRGLT